MLEAGQFEDSRDSPARADDRRGRPAVADSFPGGEDSLEGAGVYE